MLSTLCPGKIHADRQYMRIELSFNTLKIPSDLIATRANLGKAEHDKLNYKIKQILYKFIKCTWNIFIVHFQTSICSLRYACKIADYDCNEWLCCTNERPNLLSYYIQTMYKNARIPFHQIRFPAGKVPLQQMLV